MIAPLLPHQIRSGASNDRLVSRVLSTNEYVIIFMKWLSNQGYLLIVITAIAWSGNTIIGRGVVDIIPPIGLSFWRWVAVLPIFLVIAWPHLRKDLPLVKKNWKIVVVLALLSISIYNTLIYQGLTMTTAINSFLINTCLLYTSPSPRD